MSDRTSSTHGDTEPTTHNSSAGLFVDEYLIGSIVRDVTTEQYGTVISLQTCRYKNSIIAHVMDETGRVTSQALVFLQFLDFLDNEQYEKIVKASTEEE